MNELSAEPFEPVAAPPAESKDFSTRWQEMIEDTFTVALHKLDMELDALGSKERNKFDVHSVSRKGKMLTCSVDGIVPQLEVLFREGTELRVRSSVAEIDDADDDDDLYDYFGQTGMSRRKPYGSSGRKTVRRKEESAAISAVSKGFNVVKDEEHLGTLRLNLELTSKGELPDGNVSVSVDTTSRRREILKKKQKLLYFLERAGHGESTKLEETFLSGNFQVKPEGALSKSRDLDESQNQAFGRAMLFDEYPVLFIQGPPGTGKTRTIRDIVDSHIQHKRRVLVLSHSNRGMSEPAKQLLEKWTGTETRKKVKRTVAKRGEEKIFIAGNVPDKNKDKVDPDSRRYRMKKDHKYPEAQLRKVDGMDSTDLYIFTEKIERRLEKYFGRTEDDSELKQKVKDALIYEYQERCRKAEKKFKQDIEEGAAVFSTFGTLINDEMLAKTDFDVVVVDEATRMQAPELVTALEKAGTQIIFVGDPAQLGNIPMAPETQQDLAKKLEGALVPEIIASTRGKLRDVYDAESVTQALEVYNNGPYTHGIKCAKNPDKQLPFVFLNQGRRSLPNITELVSEYTYGGRLVPARKAENGNEGTVLFLDTKRLRGGEKSTGTSQRNPTESQIIGRRAVDALLREGVSPSDIGIIATYASQVDAIRNGIGRILKGSGQGRGLFAELKPNIASVDGFQGDQRKYVYMSFTRSNAEGNVGFTDEVSRINVGISRAEDRLVIVGDTSTLIDNNQDPESRARFEKLRDLVAKYGEVREIKFHQERKRKRNPDKRRAARAKTRNRKANWVVSVDGAAQRPAIAAE